MKLKASQMALKQENIELGQRIFAGMQKAIRELYAKSAANNEIMVISVNGEIRHVPAKELLKASNEL